MLQHTRRRRRARESLRRLAHLLVIALGWVGFAWMWLLVAARPWESQRLIWLIVGSLLVVPLLTGAWVLHNRSIHRRKGERQAVAKADASYAHDWHGRVVQADWAVLRHSCVVLVSVDGAHKLYRGSHVADSAHSATTTAPASPSRTRSTTVTAEPRPR
jgi:hypothetical protein